MMRGAGGLRDQGRTPLARAAALLVGAAALGASGCAEDTALQLFPPSCTDDCAQGAGGSGTSGQAGTGGVAGAINSTSTGSQGGTHGCGALGSRVRTSQLSLEAPAVPSDEYNPVLLAPRPDSTSLLGYRRADALEISVLALDASDAVERELFSTAAEEAHALLAHEQGGALVVVREDPDIFHAQFCRGGAPSQPPCNALELMRFDDSGTLQMSATLTDKLSVDTEGALFIWWFEHTARMVFAEQTYGIYFRSARTVPQPDGLVPRPGDTLRFIGADGTRLDRGWDFGCIESWSVRLEYNGVWAAVCHGGVNPYAHRVVLLEGSEERELWILEGVPPAYRAIGGLSVHGEDFWLSYVERSGSILDLHLARINRVPELELDNVIEEAQDLMFDPGYVFRTYHANLGSDLLLGWISNNHLMLALADVTTGELLEGPTEAGAAIDHFVEFTSFPNGDVGWAYANADGEISVTRVLACQD